MWWSVLHTLRLHWVEFQNKFFKGTGYRLATYSLTEIIQSKEGDKTEYSNHKWIIHRDIYLSLLKIKNRNLNIPNTGFLHADSLQIEFPKALVHSESLQKFESQAEGSIPVIGVPFLKDFIDYNYCFKKLFWPYLKYFIY